MKRFTGLVSVAAVLMTIVAILVAGTVTPADATTITVGPGGPPSYDYATIQAAINAASNGDTINVAAGT